MARDAEIFCVARQRLFGQFLHALPIGTLEHGRAGGVVEIVRVVFMPQLFELITQASRIRPCVSGRRFAGNGSEQRFDRERLQCRRRHALTIGRVMPATTCDVAGGANCVRVSYRRQNWRACPCRRLGGSTED
jgi:hypothetical protein